MALDETEFELVEDNLYRHAKKPEKFLFRVTHLGKQKRKVYTVKGSAKSKKDMLREAKVELENFRKSFIQGTLPDELITVDRLFDKYIDLKSQTKWNKQLRHSYDLYIKDHIGKMKANSIKPLHIQKIISDLEKKGLGRTQKTVIEVLRPAFKFAKFNGLISSIPTDGIVVKLRPSKKIITSPTDKLINIYRGIREYYANDPFYQAFFLLGFSGRRKGEIINLKWENINFEHGTYWLEADVTKPRQNQQYKLSPAIQELLLTFREEKGYVFASPITGNKIINIQKQVEKLKAYLNMPEFGMHMMRNVLVSAMAEQGVESVLLSGALGHTDATTINKYLSMPHLKGSEVANEVIRGLV